MDMFSYLNPGPRVQVHFEGNGRTKQADKDSCDINVIMAKYMKTGLISHAAKYAGEYGFAPAVNFHEAMNIVTRGEQMFAELPAKVRDRFLNDPGRFLEFVQDEKNREEMVEMGLLDAPEPPPKPAAKPVEKFSDAALEAARKVDKPSEVPPKEEPDTVST